MNRYFVSFIGPLNDIYPHDANKYPLLGSVEVKIHPQIDVMRELYLSKEYKDLFSNYPFSLYIKSGLLKAKYNYNVIKTVYLDLNSYRFQLSLYGKELKYYQGMIKEQVPFTEEFNYVLNNLNLNDAYLSIEGFMEKQNIPTLKVKLLEYMEKVLQSEDIPLLTEYIKYIINIGNYINVTYVIVYSRLKMLIY